MDFSIVVITDFLLNAYAWFIILYFVQINLFYFIMLLASLSAVVHYLRRNEFASYRLIIQSELSTPISIIAPAYNEESTIIESIHSLLRLDYATMEVIVVNDGSKDKTLDVLVDYFSLRESKRLYLPSLETKPVRGIYVSTKREWKKLVIVDKENGGKADALNAGINISRYPLFCAIDADSILENDALLKVVKPFLEDEKVIAVGGIVRVANGCAIERGRVTDARVSKRWLPVFQTIEYFRAFLSGRMGWSKLNGLLIISGAFGLFLKDVVMAAGGFKYDTVGEDMELVSRLHRYMIENRIPYKVVFVPDPVCWTEVPENLRTLARQRNRWHRGLLDTIIIHHKMLFNPRFKQIGLLAMPYFFIFELFGPVIEFLGYLSIPISYLIGVFSAEVLIMFFIVAVLYGVLFSLGAVLLEEISFHRYSRPMDLIKLILFAIIENFGYRQMTVIWRVKAIWDYFRGVKTWGAMKRTGFARINK